MTDKATKKFNRIFYPGIIIRIVSLFLLAGTSYAWFTTTVEQNDNQIISGKLDVNITLNSSAIALNQGENLNSWVIESGDVTINENDSILIKNIGTLDACITIDFVDSLLEDKVISVKASQEILYTFSSSGVANIYCQSEFSYNKTL